MLVSTFTVQYNPSPNESVVCLSVCPLSALFRTGPHKHLTNLTALKSWVFLAAFTLEVTPTATSPCWLCLWG